MITLNHYRVAAPAAVSLATAKVNIMNLHFVRAGLLVHAIAAATSPSKASLDVSRPALAGSTFPHHFTPISHQITGAEA